MTLDEAVAVHWATATQDDDAIAGWDRVPYRAAQGNLYVLLVAHLLPTHRHRAPVIADEVVFSILPEVGPEPIANLIGSFP